MFHSSGISKIRSRVGKKIIFWCVVVAGVAGAHHRPDFNSRCLEFKDSSYTVRDTFAVDLPDSVLLDIFHKLYHMKVYLAKVNLSLKPLKEEKEFNRIEYTYYYVVSRLMLTFERFIKRSARTMCYNMIKNERSNAIVPRVHITEGSYIIFDTPSGKQVAYYQRTVLDRTMSALYSYVITRATRRFLVDLTGYIDHVEDQLKAQCHN